MTRPATLRQALQECIPYKGLIYLSIFLATLFERTVLATGSEYKVGAAKIDITPDYPVRLSGFGFRRVESEGITHRIWAKALAFSDGDSPPSVLITVDNLGIPSSMVESVSQRLQDTLDFDPKKLTITASHTHTAPMLAAVAPTLFGMPIPEEHQEHIDRYTKDLEEHLATVAMAAINELQPGTLEFGIGQAGFARNRRTKDGPIDHDLPTLIAKNEDGKIIAIYTNYACHCVTLSHNHISGDWAGYAQTAIEAMYPGSTALVAIGCGADSNPDSGVVGDDTATAARQGKEIADGVAKVLELPRLSVTGPLSIQSKTIALDFAEAPSQTEWKERAKRTDAIGYHAKVNLARLEAGVALEKSIDYRIQTWNFGDSMAWVFLPGEVVVDYSLRLKRELDESKVWVTAYANDAPCYIPSERILKEGGYEGAGAMVYYDRPGAFASGLEDHIIETVHSLLPNAFRPPIGTDGIAPKSPTESLQCIQTHPQFKVQLVASEPLIIDPVAIDFDLEGNLWIAEMHDYPLGMKGAYEPGGRIKKLSDTTGDGQYDHATIFLENIPFPTGLKATTTGIIIGAAPDILLAKDTDADGKADQVETLFSGFAAHNYQARVNSFSWGLDNWIYAANGLFGGDISGREQPSPLDTRGRDIRFRLDDTQLETVSGLTQQGRVRDDWGNWFGCQNGVLIQHYPLELQYLAHVPKLKTPPAHSIRWLDADPGQLFPISRPISRFNDLHHQGRVTSACGIGIYRDTLLGDQFYGNAFTCEPVHNLVRRIILEPFGGTFTAKRAPEETNREFLASTDLWFRPAQVTTGPDGALWVVDMYRFLMEHPIWIRPDRLVDLDPRAGDQMGRIYRVVNKTADHPAPAAAFSSRAPWSERLASPNGVQRDLAHQAIVENPKTADKKEIQRIAHHGEIAAARAQALSVLDGLDLLDTDFIHRALADSNEEVSQQVIRLLEKIDRATPAIRLGINKLTKTSTAPHLQRQIAYSIGRLNLPEGAELIAHLLSHNKEFPYIDIAALASASAHLEKVIQISLDDPNISYSESQWASFFELLSEDQLTSAKTTLIRAVTSPESALSLPSQCRLIAANWIDVEIVHELAAKARATLALKPDQVDIASAACLVLGRETEQEAKDLALLISTLQSSEAPDLQQSCIQAIARIGSLNALEQLTSLETRLGPSARNQIVTHILQRPPWTAHWLKSVDTNKTSLTLSHSQKDQLLNHSIPEIQTLASRLFTGATTQSIRERIDHYSNVQPATGNSKRGGVHFETRCASCHALHGMGRSIGPDLRELTDRSVEHLVTEIIDPNRISLDTYQAYELECRDGTNLVGLIVEETAHFIALKLTDATVQNILREDIIRFEATGRSLMPENLEEGLSLTEMADLIAFINQTEKPMPPPRDPATIADYIMNDSRTQSERISTIEVHYALAHRLVPHIESQPNAAPVLHQVGLTTGKRNEATTLPGLLTHLANESKGELSTPSLALLSGLFHGWAESGIDPIEALSIHLDQKDHARLWNITLATALQQNPSPASSYIETIADTRPYPGKASEWHGFLRFDFEFDTRAAIVVMPHKTASGKPWIWRARFFGHEPQLDIALLEKGYHLVYLDVADLFGAPIAVAHWDRFYQHLVTNKHFNGKVVLEGMSRGGLIIYNWANANPNFVAGIYADAPVLDFKSWPGGPRRRTHQGQQRTWEALLKAYGFSSDAEAHAFSGNPVDHTNQMVDSHIPLFHVCGDSDVVVPYADNTGLFKRRYHRAGGRRFQEIVKPHIGHHPHSLPNPQPLVDFVEGCYQNLLQ